LSTSEIAVHQLPIDVDCEPTHAVLEVPPGVPRALVVLAHGLSASRESRYLREIAHRFHALSVATVSMDAPLHGSRRSSSLSKTFEDWVVAWQTFWRAGGSTRMTAEYTAMLDACQEPTPESTVGVLAGLPVGYWGISLATQTGVPWLAEDPRPQAAVLGQFRGDGLLMQTHAPRVTAPVFFIQQQDDELHSLEVSQQLFDLLGSKEKVLRSSPGSHTAIPVSVLRDSVAWLAERLDPATHE
jgi:fermentation-respiration switch protein FrsA (DUF1100 family)